MLTEKDENKLLDICKRKLEQGATTDEIINFVTTLHGNQIWENISKSVLEYAEIIKKTKEHTKHYWMLLSNPSTWYCDKYESYKVNQNLFELNEDIIESWKIDGTKDIPLKMREGELGIIKVGEDNRSLKERTDKEGNIVDKLESGIYGIFEITKDEDGDIVYETEDGYWYVNIRVIDNFFHRNAIISKEKAIELLGENIYNRMSSGEITKKIFEKVIAFQKSSEKH